MIPKLEIERAIGVHAMWKARLRTALESGLSTGSAAFIHRDDTCEFGEWLMGPDLTPADKATGHFETVSRLHAEFHHSAAQLVDLARSGKPQPEDFEAVFQEASIRLIAAMEGWHASLE
ncbi:MAG TPA: CZB domain-containing protein [Holophagaceae bacterium]|nr:CZB domain-containing protein [Holophagaceae bacterium]